MAHTAARADLRNVSDWERVASGIGGAALVAFALVRPSLPTALLAVAGGLLIERGVTGHCSAYEMLGIDTHQSASPARLPRRGARPFRDVIEEASEHSFPASDPPSWNPHSVGHPA